jgi:uncharacterized protein (DUF58 family)
MSGNELTRRDTAAAAATTVERDPRIYASLPELVRLQHRASGFSFLPKQPIHSLLAGRHGSRLRGRGLDFEELRQYLPGDDPRTIDWKVTARTGKPFVRVYTEERDRPVLLVVDQRVSMFFGSTTKMKSVAAAEAAALSAWRVLDAGDRVGALVFSDTEIRETRPNRSRQTVMRVLHDVVEFNHRLGADGPSGKPEMLNEVLEHVARVAKHDYLVVLISDFEGAAPPSTRELVTRIGQHNDVLGLFVHDPLELELPDSRSLVTSDGELQLEVRASDRRLRSQIGDEMRRRLDVARDLHAKHGMPTIPITTVGDVAEQVREYIGSTPGAVRG